MRNLCIFVCVIFGSKTIIVLFSLRMYKVADQFGVYLFSFIFIFLLVGLGLMRGGVDTDVFFCSYVLISCWFLLIVVANWMHVIFYLLRARKTIFQTIFGFFSFYILIWNVFIVYALICVMNNDGVIKLN